MDHTSDDFDFPELHKDIRITVGEDALRIIFSDMFGLLLKQTTQLVIELATDAELIFVGQNFCQNPRAGGFCCSGAGDRFEEGIDDQSELMLFGWSSWTAARRGARGQAQVSENFCGDRDVFDHRDQLHFSAALGTQ